MIEQIVKGNLLKDLGSVGVYSIHHSEKPERLYVGSTSKIKSEKASHRGFYKRFYDHLRELRLNKHHCKYLQNTVNKYGLQGIIFTILEICDGCSVKEIRLKEQLYIDKLKPAYNHNKTVFPKGREWSLEQRQKQSSKMLGRSLSKIVYEKMQISVQQISKDGVLLNTYSSMAQASRILGIDRASINNCILGKRGTAGGFLWKKAPQRSQGDRLFSK